MGQGKDGKQPIQIDWSVYDPKGKKLGTVSQKNEVPQGSLDGVLGQDGGRRGAGRGPRHRQAAAAQGRTKPLRVGVICAIETARGPGRLPPPGPLARSPAISNLEGPEGKPNAFRCP